MNSWTESYGSYAIEPRYALDVRISDNVLEADCWTVGTVWFCEAGYIVKVETTQKGVYDLPNFIGWSYAKLAKWQDHDDTGRHPENYYEVRIPGASRWESLLSEQDVRDSAREI